MILHKFIIHIILLKFLFCISNIDCAAKNDQIKHLPGLNHIVNFKHYSGYLDGNPGDHLHYWFVEASSNPSTAPVILWLNGGPGCSSMDGLFNELGPYRISEDGKSLILNDYSWNKIGNLLFLESPACVGFSYRDNGSCVSSDDQTSMSNYLALRSFFKKFPEYRKNPFYITGESYGGIYIPTLSIRVLEGNEEFPINFKGYAVGNGLSSFEMNSDSIVFFAYYHGLLGPELWTNLVNYCCKGGNEAEDSCNFPSTNSAKCQNFTYQAMNIIFNQGLNMYNLYAKCLHASQFNGTSRYHFERRNLLYPFLTKSNKTDNFRRLHNTLKLDPPCTDSTNMRVYLNDPIVQAAIHVKKIHWDICSDAVNGNYITQYKSMRKQYDILTRHVRGLLYNGDVDMACNFLGDEWFAESLKLPVKEPRRMWHYKDQVGGFVKRFKNLDVLTIRGAGHMVPLDKPGQALQMIEAFVGDKIY